MTDIPIRLATAPLRKQFYQQWEIRTTEFFHFLVQSMEKTMNEQQRQSFESLAQGENAPGFFAEFWDFLRHNKKWWLTPIVVILLLFGVLVLLSGTAAAPFIYTLF
jgi:hypothetical protein